MLELPYVAGLFDGEGCVQILQKRGPNRRYCQVTVDISNTDSNIIKLLEEQFGGSVREMRIPKAKPHWKRQYRWGVMSKQAASFLEQIMPYLRIKKAEAMIALQMREVLGDVKAQEAMAQQLLELRRSRRPAV